ncbi:tyrosine-type recombinase/integrase [Motiliproteus sp. MSK22-1]|uniref:tyrosine-type recombinase/integrase n=1 Tax=Motiliproteus sp. MSK22-1 TaxID=1897630 RepID=UPI0018E953BB|nr:tyrosine-type recombinase/integrase [Motiliproteus sp. MSK22-1]
MKLCPDTGRHYFVIQEGKTKAARRSVPLHRQLVDDGLLDWLSGDQKALIFPTANQNPNRVTDLFGSLLDKKVNDVGERIVFHSVRHSFITKARAAGVETVLVQQVVGHEKSGAGVTDRYTHCFQLRQLLPVVDAVIY